MLYDPLRAHFSLGAVLISSMHAQVSVAAPPNTSINASRGVVTSGNLTLAFHLAPDEGTHPALDMRTTEDARWSPKQASRRRSLQQHAGAAGPAAGTKQDSPADGAAVGREGTAAAVDASTGAAGATFGRTARRGDSSTAELGPHLFTVGITGEIAANKLALEPDAPARPGSWRLGISMELLLSSLRSQARTYAAIGSKEAAGTCIMCCMMAGTPPLCCCLVVALRDGCVGSHCGADPDAEGSDLLLPQVLSSDVGEVNEARLQLLFSVVAFLLQARAPALQRQPAPHPHPRLNPLAERLCNTGSPEACTCICATQRRLVLRATGLDT